MTRMIALLVGVKDEEKEVGERERLLEEGENGQ
ncbi:hypothetical protein Krac_6257 [Ktedonobacter racemifer DSM 44963]|uniref:Uncharacterized protein n=1 Tax=Ktedonobacter racemifer DSM 44963 TaxID=485913 RepID=D6TYM7_KTERA|nr:hypothetical protein Krac_6257 [Ktedonobacter racemifer DSM 44963]